jgi:FAD:protein FMN transferase
MSVSTAAQSVRFGMGTGMTHTAYGSYAKDSLQAVEEEAARLENMLSCFLPESDISRINRSAGIQPVQVSLETFELLTQSCQFSEECQGLFDVTVGPLVRLWDYKSSSVVPDEYAIRQTMALVNYKELILDPKERTAALRRTGQSIDLGAIGKGYAGDKLLKIFRKFCITTACSNIGGNVAVLGKKPDGSPWRVGIRHPRKENSLIGAVAVADKAVVTSGDYQRFFLDRNGQRRHHILNPQTGYPSESGLISVTVVADHATDADAMSTIIFAAGLQKGAEILKRRPGAGAVLIDTDLRLFVTTDLKDCFQAEKGVKAEILVI